MVIGMTLVPPREPTTSQALGIFLEYSILFGSSFVFRGSVLNLTGQNYTQLTTITLRGAAAFAGMASVMLRDKRAEKSTFLIDRAFFYLTTALEALEARMKAVGVNVPDAKKARAILDVLEQSDDITSVPRQTISNLAQNLSTISNFGEVSTAAKDFVESFPWSKNLEVLAPKQTRTRYDIILVIAATLGGLGATLTALTPVLPSGYGDAIRAIFSSADTIVVLITTIVLGVTILLSRRLAGPVPLVDVLRY